MKPRLKPLLWYGEIIGGFLLAGFLIVYTTLVTLKLIDKEIRRLINEEMSRRKY